MTIFIWETKSDILTYIRQFQTQSVIFERQRATSGNTLRPPSSWGWPWEQKDLKCFINSCQVMIRVTWGLYGPEAESVRLGAGPCSNWLVYNQVPIENTGKKPSKLSQKGILVSIGQPTPKSPLRALNLLWVITYNVNFKHITDIVRPYFDKLQHMFDRNLRILWTPLLWKRTHKFFTIANLGQPISKPDCLVDKCFLKFRAPSQLTRWLFFIFA